MNFMPRYAVYFAGETRPDIPLADVKQNLAKLFKADPARIEQLFSGNEITLKTDLDETTAAKYKAILEQAGALVQLKSTQPSHAAAQPITPAKHGLLNVQPRDAYMAAFQHIEATDFGIAALGSDLTEPSEQPVTHIDTSRLSLAPVGSNLQDPTKEHSHISVPDTSHLKLQAD